MHCVAVSDSEGGDVFSQPPKKFSGGGGRRRPLPLPLFAPDPTYKILQTNFYKILTLDVIMYTELKSDR